MTDSSTDPRQRTAVRKDGEPLALVKHLDGEGFTVVDATTHDVLGTVGEGRQPHAVVVHPAGRWALVPYMASGTVEVLDLRDRSVAATVDAGTAPVGAAMAGDSRRLLVTTYGPLPGGTEPGLLVLSTDAAAGTATVADRLPLGTAAGVAVDGRGDAWVALKDDDQVVRLSPAGAGSGLAVVDRVHVPAGPQGLRYAPAYGLLGVDCVDGDAVAFVDPVTAGVREVVDAPNPRSGAVVPAHDRWFVADTEGDGLAVVDLATVGSGAGVDRIRLGTPTAFTDAAPDGSTVVADAEDDDRVTFVDPAGPAVVGRVVTGRRPHHPRFGAGGQVCYVPNADDDTVTVLDTTRLPEAAEVRTELDLPDGTGPSGCYFTDRRIDRRPPHRSHR